MRIEITGRGIYGTAGEVAIGTIIEVSKEPKGLDGRYRVLADEKGKEPVTNPKKGKDAETGLKAEHHGGGKFNITQGETVLASGLSKADADAFNALSDDEKAEYVKKQG